MKKIILITILSIVLLGSIGGWFYWKINNRKQISGVENKINTPINIPTTSINPSTTTSTTEPANTTKSVKDTSTPTPAVKDKPTPTPTCDEYKKADFWSQYMYDISKAEMERRRLYDEALDRYNTEISQIDQRCSTIWDPYAREDCRKNYLDMAGKTLDDARNTAKMSYDGDESYLNAMLNLNLKGINCQ